MVEFQFQGPLVISKTRWRVNNAEDRMDGLRRGECAEEAHAVHFIRRGQGRNGRPDIVKHSGPEIARILKSAKAMRFDRQKRRTS